MRTGISVGIASVALALAAAVPASAQTEPLYKTGALIVKEGQRADLDASRTRDAGADIWFAAVTATNRSLVPQNHARIGYLGKVRPSYRRCERAARSTAPIKLSMLIKGSFVCVKTEYGRIGWIQIVAPAGASPGTMGLKYRLWGSPKLCCRIDSFYRFSADSRCRGVGMRKFPTRICRR